MTDWKIIEGDCLAVMPGLDPVDHVITDPPYDERTHAPGAARTLTRDGPKDIAIDFAPLVSVDVAVELMLRVSLRWVICFCGVEQLGGYATAAGRAAWVRGGAWDRFDGAPQFSGDRPAQGFDGIAIMHNPAAKKRWNAGGKRGVWRCGVVRGGRVHPTQKPLALMRDLVRDFTDRGETILDPFCGSGSTGVAAIQLGRNFVGIERDPKYAQIARDRLAAAERGQPLTEYRSGQRTLFGEER